MAMRQNPRQKKIMKANQNCAVGTASLKENELDDNTSLPDQISKIIKSSASGGMRELVNESVLTVKKNYGLK